MGIFRHKAQDPVAASPPDQDAVIRRTICVAAVSELGRLADASRHGTDVAPHANELKEAIVRDGFEASQSKSERKLFAKDLGNWSDGEIANAIWRNEAVVALAWSISIVPEMPPYDTQLDAVTLIRIMRSQGALDQASLRAAADLELARSTAERWHWRSRTTQIQKQPKPPQLPAGLTLDDIVRQSAQLAFDESAIPPPIDGDYPAFGKAYRDLDELEYSTITSITMERHFALNWVCGYSDDWDKTPTDT